MDTEDEMAPVKFDVVVAFDAPPRQVWDALIDWKGHEEWIPATRVEVGAGDSTAVGATFVAWTGYGPVALEDRMRVAECSWIEDDQTGTCRVEKLGPVLSGVAGFTVEPDGDGAQVRWFEDVAVRRLPRFLAPVVSRIGALGFRFGMRRLAGLLQSAPRLSQRDADASKRPVAAEDVT